MSKHTQRPWHIGSIEGGDIFIWSDDEEVLIGCASSEDVSAVEALSHAHLIAAAPDMLAACRDAVDQGQHADGCRWWDTSATEMARNPLALERAAAACDCYLAICRAAIAKAEGGGP